MPRIEKFLKMKYFLQVSKLTVLQQIGVVPLKIKYHTPYIFESYR